MAIIKYRDALRLALKEEMARNPDVFLIGEGIGERGGSYKVTDQLFKEFGPDRVIDTPLSEASFVAMGIGAALVGTRPVVELLFIDFACLAMDQIINQAAKYNFMSGGQAKVGFLWSEPRAEQGTAWLGSTLSRWRHCSTTSQVLPW